MKLPEIRRLFIPDPGYIIAEADLDRADLQVVVWEAKDEDLKRRLRMGVDLHLTNAFDLESLPMPDENELVPSHPKYLDHLRRHKPQRQRAKSFVHGTNYGGSPTTMARAAGVSVRQSELMQRNWFGAHPGIRRWHKEVEGNLTMKREIQNAFGFKRYYFDRIEGVLPQALAWIPQSTVAIVINKGWLSLHKNLPEVQVLLQVHDSLVFQYPAGMDPCLRERIKENLKITIPYSDPLIIPAGLKISHSSWGECSGVQW